MKIESNCFYEISKEEMETVDGGGWKSVAVGAAVTAAGIVGVVASCGTGIPAYGAIATGISIIGGCGCVAYGAMDLIGKR